MAAAAVAAVEAAAGVITVLTAAAKPCQAVVTTAAVRLIAAEVATRELRHRVQRRGADAGDFKTPPRHQSGDVRVLGGDEGQPEHPLQAVRRGVLGGNSSGLRLAVAIALYPLKPSEHGEGTHKAPCRFCMPAALRKSIRDRATLARDKILAIPES